MKIRLSYKNIFYLQTWLSGGVFPDKTSSTYWSTCSNILESLTLASAICAKSIAGSTTPPGLPPLIKRDVFEHICNPVISGSYEVI